MAAQEIRAHLPIGKREKVPKRILLVKISFIFARHRTSSKALAGGLRSIRLKFLVKAQHRDCIPDLNHDSLAQQFWE